MNEQTTNVESLPKKEKEKVKKTSSSKKSGFFKAIGNFFKGIAKFFVLTVREMKKVRWPNKQTMKDASKVVLTFILLFGLYIVLDDFIIAKLLKMIKY